MADNNYAVAPNFPLGVILDQLVESLPTVWPPDLFPLTTIHRGKPAAGGLITAGSILITTQRALTTPENDDALAFFQTFVPAVDAQGGVLEAQLGAGGFNGETAFVLDEPRQGNSSSGVLCYWDGRDRTWRRIRDDGLVVTIA